MKFGDKLIALRKKNGLSQEELAEKLGVSRQSVSKWESNSTYPETDKIVQIANIFDCSMDDLINDNINNIESIERKNKNNLNNAFDSFLEFITKTINMFCDMKFTSGFKCVIEMGILVLILFVLGLFFVEFSSDIVSNLFAFMPSMINNIFYKTIRSVFALLWVVVSLIILVHVFKIRYLNYYDKVMLENTKEETKNEEIKQNKKEDKNEKIKKENNPKVIIRDEKHRPFAFLSVLSRIIMFFIKFILVFFVLALIFSLIVFVALFVVTISLITTSSIFFGIAFSLLSLIIVSIIFLLLIINFIFSKKSNYKIMLIIFISSIVLFSVGVGISIISFKNFEIKEDMTKTTKEEIIIYDENIIITNGYLNDIKYEVDNSMNDEIKLIIEYNDNFSYYQINKSDDVYNSFKAYYIHSYSDLNIKKIYNMIKEDLKNNVISSYTNDILNVKVVSNKKIVDKLIENTKQLYFVDIKENDNVYELTNFEHRINGYTQCSAKYNYKENKVITNSDNCVCNIKEEDTNRGTSINYSCEIKY